MIRMSKPGRFGIPLEPVQHNQTFLAAPSFAALASQINAPYADKVSAADLDKDIVQKKKTCWSKASTRCFRPTLSLRVNVLPG